MSSSETSAAETNTGTSVEDRLTELEQRVDNLAHRIDNLVTQVARLSRLQKPADNQEEPASSEPEDKNGSAHETISKAATDVAMRPEITPGMVSVIQLISQGRGEEAQRQLHSLPETELAGQPAVVALVAAALFIQRGDYAAGLKAVNKARRLTDDPRLQRLIQLIEKQTTQ